MTRFTLSITVAALLSSMAADWREFRGPGGSSSVALQASMPDQFDVATGQNIAWQSELPGRGVSGPVVAGGRVLVTASSGSNRDRLHVLAFDQDSGKKLWHRRFWSTGRNYCHPTSANAAPTPVTDGERVFAFYSSNDLACFDLDGNMQWFRGLAVDHPGLGNDVGMSSSPVVADGVVLVQCECQANSFAAAYDCRTGEERWSLKRPAAANWASPLAMEIQGEQAPIPTILLQSSESLAAYRAETGELLWELKLSCSGIPSVSSGEGVAYVPTSGGLVAVATAADHAGDRILWRQSGLQCGNPSPIVTKEELLIVNRAGVLTSASIENGRTNWKKRLGGRYWATPVAVGNLLYAMTDAGDAIIFDIEAKQVLNKCSLGKDEEVLGSPAVAAGALFVRSHKYLWKIASGSSE